MKTAGDTEGDIRGHGRVHVAHDLFSLAEATKNLLSQAAEETMPYFVAAESAEILKDEGKGAGLGKNSGNRGEESRLNNPKAELKSKNVTAMGLSRFHERDAHHRGRR